MPVLLLLALGFAAPLVAVTSYSFATPRSFEVFRSFTLANYAAIFDPATRSGPRSPGPWRWRLPPSYCWP